MAAQLYVFIAVLELTFLYVHGQFGTQIDWSPDILRFNPVAIPSLTPIPVFPQSLPPIGIGALTGTRTIDSRLPFAATLGQGFTPRLVTANNNQMRVLPTDFAATLRNNARTFAANGFPRPGRQAGINPWASATTNPFQALSGSALDLSQMSSISNRFVPAQGPELIRQLTPPPDTETTSFDNANNDANSNSGQNRQNTNQNQNQNQAGTQGGVSATTGFTAVTPGIFGQPALAMVPGVSQFPGISGIPGIPGRMASPLFGAFTPPFGQFGSPITSGVGQFGQLFQTPFTGQGLSPRPTLSGIFPPFNFNQGAAGGTIPTLTGGQATNPMTQFGSTLFGPQTQQGFGTPPFGNAFSNIPSTIPNFQANPTLTPGFPNFPNFGNTFTGVPNNFPGAMSNFPTPTNTFPGAFPGSQNNFPGATNQFPGSQNNFPGAANQFPGSQNNFPGSANQFPGSTNNIPGTNNNFQSPGNNMQRPGINVLSFQNAVPRQTAPFGGNTMQGMPNAPPNPPGMAGMPQTNNVNAPGNNMPPMGGNPVNFPNMFPNMQGGMGMTNNNGFSGVPPTNQANRNMPMPMSNANNFGGAPNFRGMGNNMQNTGGPMPFNPNQPQNQQMPQSRPGQQIATGNQNMPPGFNAPWMNPQFPGSNTAPNNNNQPPMNSGAGNPWGMGNNFPQNQRGNQFPPQPQGGAQFPPAGNNPQSPVNPGFPSPNMNNPNPSMGGSEFGGLGNNPFATDFNANMAPSGNNNEAPPPSDSSDVVTTIVDEQNRVLWRRDSPVSRDQIMQAVEQLADGGGNAPNTDLPPGGAFGQFTPNTGAQNRMSQRV